ncbi:MAG: PhzF family phenazine biosynthesis protein [Flavobacteriaceae bacterium]
MKYTLYQVDAFAKKVFEGNPAAVCILPEWIDAPFMQKIASENNLSETAFAVKKGNLYELRWFTPEVEVALCGHATLATAHVLFTHYGHKENTIQFKSMQRGILAVEKKENGLLELDFPSDAPKTTDIPDGLIEAIGQAPNKVLRGKTDYMLIYASQEFIESIHPNHFELSKLDCRGVIVTAPGKRVDFVSRFFAPGSGVPEDPVTGSAHTMLIPYWSKILEKSSLHAKQLSKRGGNLYCQFLGDRVKIGGSAITYLQGEIEI